MKNKITLLLLIFGTLTLFYSCQKDDQPSPDSVSINQESQGLNVTMSNWQHFRNLNPKVSQRIMSIKERSVQSRNTKSEIYDFVIDTSRVQIIEQVGFKTYAFSVNREQPISGVMENYIYKQNDDGTYQQYLLGYFCTFDTEGNIQYTSNDLQITPIDDPSLLSRGSCYPEFVQVGTNTVCTTASTCSGSASNGKHTKASDCECDDTPTCRLPGWVTCRDVDVFGWTNCPGGLPDEDLPGPIDPPGSGGNTYTAPDGTVYTILVPTLLFQGILNCLNGLGEIGQTDNTTIDPDILASLNLTMAQTTPMINYLNSSGCSEQAQADVLEDIYAVIIAKITECLGSELEASINSLSYENLGTIHSYLIVGNGCSEEAKEAMVLAIEGLSYYNETNFPGMDLGYEYQWWLDDAFVESNFNFDIEGDEYDDLTTEEKILVKFYPFQALIIRSNKAPAVAETISRYVNNGRNDKSDAFRHTFFNAMNSNDIGSLVAKLFSAAHESEVQPNLILEKEMDLYNNNVGHNIGSNSSIFVSDQELSDTVYQALLFGSLKYLSPLTPPIAPPNFGITSATLLIRTNQ